eukprot:scaffold63176_cov32-Tisochrysis_lutea.AAC.1
MHRSACRPRGKEALEQWVEVEIMGWPRQAKAKASELGELVRKREESGSARPQGQGSLLLFLACHTACQKGGWFLGGSSPTVGESGERGGSCPRMGEPSV